MNPYEPALALSHWKQALLRPSQLMKSMAKPTSCIDCPGRAVGGEHDDGDISQMA